MAMLEGLVAVFDSVSVPIPAKDGRPYREVFRYGAFAKVLSSGIDIPMTAEHDPYLVLGRLADGTLRLWEDYHGLRFEVELPRREFGREVLKDIRSGLYRGGSIIFRRSNWQWIGVGGASVREIVEVGALSDVTICRSPSYTDTFVREMTPRLDAATARLRNVEASL